MGRSEMIEKLVDRDIDSFFDRADMADYLSYILRIGVVGYDNYSDEELLNECLDYGLIEENENA